MIRLFLEGTYRPQFALDLSDNQYHYLAHVMRVQNGSEIACFNGQDGEWLGQFTLNKKSGKIQLIKQVKPQQNLPELVLCPAIIKRDNMDLILQKATELGATQIYPILADRSVVKNLNQNHAQSIIREAAEQCERLDIPTLHPPMTLEDVIQKLKANHHLIWLSERGKTQMKSKSNPPALFVGPEGGWTPAEQKVLKNSASEWHFGNTILRAETACIAGLAIWQNQIQ